MIFISLDLFFLAKQTLFFFPPIIYVLAFSNSFIEI